MSKNIFVISASLRNGSNSDMLADEFMRGALESGNKAEKLPCAVKTLILQRLPCLPENR